MAMKKSSRPARDEAAGIINRGKYILVMRCELPTRLFPDAARALAKYVQGRRPA
jgi:hypothetical protein